MYGCQQAPEEKLKARFDGALQELIDDYLKEGLSPSWIAYALVWESNNGLEDRKKELEAENAGP